MKNINKVVVADDHDIIREAVKLFLQPHQHLQVVAETGDGSQVLRLCREHQPDLLLLDITFQNRDGIDILKQAKKEFPQLNVLMFSAHEEQKYAIRALKAGASGYLNKQFSVDFLVPAIECVLAGNKYISQSLAQELANRVQTDFKPVAYEKLSDRELQTLRFIAQGLSVSDIADKLNLSVKTISMYRARTLEKLNLRHNAELIRYAIDHELS